MKGTSFTPNVSVCQVESNLPGEDRYVCRVTEDILTYGIYDGHGGYLAADIACATLQDMIIADIQSVAVECRSNLKIAEIIDAAFITVDDMIITQALRLHRLSKESSVKTKPSDGEGSNKTAKFMGRAGSCAAVVIITGGMLFVAHVGYGFCLILLFDFGFIFY
jgi:serine/threonine protein phosphatase PrpC